MRRFASTARFRAYVEHFPIPTLKQTTSSVSTIWDRKKKGGTPSDQGRGRPTSVPSQILARP
jgi:hypothetical protein